MIPCKADGVCKKALNTIAANASHSLPAKKDAKPAEPKRSLSLGAVWNLDGDSKIQSSIDEKAQVQLSYIQNLRKGVELTLSSGICLKSANFTKAGAGVAFSF